MPRIKHSEVGSMTDALTEYEELHSAAKKIGKPFSTKHYGNKAVRSDELLVSRDINNLNNSEFIPEPSSKTVGAKKMQKKTIEKPQPINPDLTIPQSLRAIAIKLVFGIIYYTYHLLIFLLKKIYGLLLHLTNLFQFSIINNHPTSTKILLYILLAPLSIFYSTTAINAAIRNPECRLKNITQATLKELVVISVVTTYVLGNYFVEVLCGEFYEIEVKKGRKFGKRGKSKSK